MPALHIITLVKWVPDAQLERGFTAQRRIDRTEGILGELDEHPLEAALQISESLSDRQVRVSALTIGPAGASAALKKALQIGADDGYHLTDDALAGADVSATSAAAAAAIQHVRSLAGLDAEYLVLTGMASEDGETGAVPAQLAQRLGVPALTQATALGIDGARLSVTRTAGTRQQKLACALPAVVSVTDQANEPRYPNFRAIMKARKKPVTTFSLAETGLDAAAVQPKVQLLSADPRPAREPGEIIHDDGTAGRQLVDFLQKERLL